MGKKVAAECSPAACGRHVLSETSPMRQELFWCNTRLLEDSAESTLGEITGVIGNGRISLGARIVLDFVAARGVAVKREPQRTKSAHHFAISKSREPSHFKDLR